MSIIYTEEMLVKKLSSYKKFSVIATVVIMLFGVYIGVQSYQRASYVMSDYSTIKATVTKAQHWQEEGKKGRMKDIYEINYSFNLNGKSHSSSFRTNNDNYNIYKASGIVEIAYSNKDHSQFDRFELLKSQSSIIGLAGRMGIMLIAVIFFFTVIGLIVKVKLRKKVGMPIQDNT